MHAENIPGANAEAVTPYKGEAIARAAKVLSCFSPRQAIWTLDDLAAKIDVPRNTLRGILDTLAMHGMLRQDSSGAYRLGYAWLKLGALRRNQFDTRTIALPIMRRIRDAVNETVILSVRVGDQRVHVDYVESTQPIRRLAQIGSSGPLHVGAAGIALLASLPQSARDAYLSHAKSGLTPAAYKLVERACAAAERHGFAAAVGTVNPDTAAIAAGTRLYSGECVAITISCPTERFNREREATCADLVKDAIKRLSREFGVSP